MEHDARQERHASHEKAQHDLVEADRHGLRGTSEAVQDEA